MKRNMDLIRDLLILIEEQGIDSKELKLPSEMDRAVAVYHLNLQAGFTENNIQYADDEPMWIYSKLTWDGHDFLDSIKNDTIWNETKEAIKSKGLEIGQLSIGVLKEYVKIKLNKQLGINTLRPAC